MPGDEGDTWNAIQAERREKRRQNGPLNKSLIEKSGIPFESKNFGQVLVIRQPYKPTVAFYPATGKWLAEGSTVYAGGATAFIRWYSKQLRVDRLKVRALLNKGDVN